MARIGGAGRIGRGLAAGAVASAVAAPLIGLGLAIGWFGDADPIAALATAVGARQRIDGWIVYFLLGSIGFGLLFAFSKQRFAGPMWRRGLILSVYAWMVLQFSALSANWSGISDAGGDVFGALLSLVLSALFGAILGAVYGRLQNIRFPPGRRRYGTPYTSRGR